MSNERNKLITYHRLSHHQLATELSLTNSISEEKNVFIIL